MRGRLPIVAAAALIALASPTRADPAQCALTVRDRLVASGRCDADFATDHTFTMTIHASGTEHTISIFGDRTGATGTWDRRSRHHHAFGDTGRLVRDGRCWGNAEVLACASRDRDE